jgi:hypothetical protein
MTTLISILSVTVWTSVLAIVGVLGREWILKQLETYIQSKYDRELEAYKDKLKLESDKEIERLKSQLQITAAERSIKLTRVFEDQANVIAQTYSKLVETIMATATSTLTPSTQSSIIDTIGAKINAFKAYYHPHKLYLPKHIQTSIDKFLLDTHYGLDALIRDWRQNSTLQNPAVASDKWASTFSIILVDCQKIHEQLDDDFKRILGLDTTQRQNNTIQ